MILQKLLFPHSSTCSRQNMYYKGNDIVVFGEDAHCAIPRGSSLDGHTYFNSLSICKYKKYTTLENLMLRLDLEGEFQVLLHHARKMLGAVKDNVIAEQHVVAINRQTVALSVPSDETDGILYFQLNALSDDARFFGGAWETELDESKLPHVKIAIGICTFRRENFIAKNIEIFRREILENDDSPLRNNLEVFISDNGKTLSADLETQSIHIFPNKNVGGAGGFTRAMIEIKKVAKQNKITHILLMDDDVRLNPDSIERIYRMLQLLKPEYKNAFIGGHMLKLDTPHIQSEAADHWDIASHHPVKYNYNLEKIDFLIKNEIEDSVNYFGWWCCCIPAATVTDNNLPLPIFIKRDDIEYGLRNGRTFITMNGICVWHEPFEYKYSSYLEYYYFRNMCIINSRHRLSFTDKRLIQDVKKRVLTFLLQYRYRDAELTLLGIQHYLQGIDWLAAQDGEKLNQEVMKLGYKKVPLDKIDFVFTHGVYETNLKHQIGRKGKLARLLTLNGMLLPGGRNIVVPMYQPSLSLFFRARKVLNYEEVSNTAFVTQRDDRAARYILKQYRKTKKLIKQNFRRVTQEYRDRYDELINIRFWNKYLFEEGTAPEIKSGLDNLAKPKNTPLQKKEIWFSRFFRLLQWSLFWLPVKKKRVMVYIHDRKGFTCNPKYIVKKLREQYGDRLEIIWATMHPETCQEVRDLGVHVIKSNSPLQARLYLRTRFFITNDAFPAWAAHRFNQKWMNTWHAGMNYKHIGYDYLAPMSRLAKKLFVMKNREPDFYLSGSHFFTEDTAKSFRMNESTFVPTGLPRNDLFFESHPEIDEKIRAHYNIEPDRKLAIFAPTFRRGMKSDTYGMDFHSVRTALEERFGGKWTILFRNHNFVKGKQKYSGAIDVSAYHDMQDLMYASDVLISDYSSCLWDFLMTGKPAFVYAPDLEEYRSNDRSFAYPFEKWPYPVAQNNAEMVSAIREFDQAAFDERVRRHLEDAGNYDDGSASKKVAELIAKYCLK